MSKQGNITRKLALDSPDKKPSVFERLGSKSCVDAGKNVCRNWAQNGTCPLNKTCKLAHTHVLISPSKRSKIETMKKSVIVHKKSKDDNKKSLRSHQSSEKDWVGWELGDLEDADEKVLEKRKQQLQRELQLQLKKEKELTRNKDKRTEKKRATSTSSSSSTTTESSSSSTSSSTSSSEPRKRLSRKRKHASTSTDSEVSPHRKKKSPKTAKGKVTVVKKTVERKDSKVVTEGKSKSVVPTKKSVVQKKSYSPSWEKSRGRSPTKQTSKKSPHHSPETKNKSSSPRYDKTVAKSKSRGFSPKPKTKEPSPKRTMRKVKESSAHAKEKPRQSPAKTRTSPARVHKVSPSRSRRHEESSDKRRSHYDDRKHSPRRDRSREKDRKRDVRRGRSNDDDNGGLKKGGKILPLKPSSYNKDGSVKKDAVHHKSSDKSSDPKSKDEDNEKDRNRMDRDRERGEKEKTKCERDRAKHKKGSDEHDRRPVRERDSDRNTIRGRDDRCRDREAERLRFAKEREAERQKEREEALERCRERQRERERLEKERREKEDKKHQRDASDNKGKDFERELPSLLDLKAENPVRNHGDSANSKNADKHLQRDTRRNLEKGSDKMLNQDRDGRDRGTPDKDHDRRDLRRSVENDRRLGDKDYDRRNREGDLRNSSEVRRSVGDGRRGVDEGGDSRRPWDDVRRVMDPIHGRRSLDPGISDRRQHPLARRSGDDHYRRGREGDLDIRDFPLDERRARKLLHPDWDPKDQNLDYRDPDVRDDWNLADRHLDWNARYDHKWRDHEDSRDGWNHYPRRPPLEEWNNDWPQEQSRAPYPEERLDRLNDEFPDNGKRHTEPEPTRPAEPNKAKETTASQEEVTTEREKPQEGDALSDISDDPDDILNQDDEPAEESAPATTNTQNVNQQVCVRSNEFLFEQRRPLLECLGERSLDFEEISDEELEEEARVSKGIVDVLGADWAGLVQETRPKPKRFESQGSAHRRWMMDRIISRFGISSKYAGQKFTEKLLKKYSRRQVKVEPEKSATIYDCETENSKTNEAGGEVRTVKEEVEDMKPIKTEAEKENVEYNTTAAAEPMEETVDLKPETNISIFHSVPALHSALREAQITKSSLFASHNRYKRALSARTDLNLRRELCDLPSKEPLHFTPPLENKLYETSVQLFYGNLPTAAV